MSALTKVMRIFLACGLLFISLAIRPETVYATGSCGTGSWTSGNLEIHHINIGQGDSTLIVGPTGASLLYDAGESNWNSSAKAQIIGAYVEGVLGCKSIDYVVISHFHLDHVGYVGYGGLWNLVEAQGFTVGKTLVRDYNTYLGDTSGTFTKWKTYLEGVGQSKLNPVTVTGSIGQVNLGTGVVFNVVTHDGNGTIMTGDFSGDANPPSENDYSIGVVISYGAFDEWIGGDLGGQYEIGGFGYTYHDIEHSVAPEVGDVDVYKVNHHASSHSSSITFVNQIDPEVSIVAVGNSNTYGHPTQTVMDRILATSTVYMTERGDINTNIGSAIVAGNIVIKTSNGSTYTVNGVTYTATEPIRIDADNDGYFAEVDPADNNPDSIPSPNGGCGSIYQNCSVNVLTFVDVPFGHPLHDYIQALYDAGFTGGCSTSPLMFCPDQILDRAQSAVFMLRGAKGSTYTPPPAPWNTFVNESWVGFEWAQPWAEGMYQEGLTTGCQTSPLKFCPANQLPRVEASIFGLKMKYGVAYTPPSASATLFADFPSTDPSYWGIAWAEKAYVDGLLPACGTQGGKPMFCPGQLVNRAWGAYLIVKAKNLPLP